ncbi:MAG: BON domain-containing protein [Acidobacteria bacterium]|nr:BON domain-containing protein [Acidobacteriota bacterium]
MLIQFAQSKVPKLVLVSAFALTLASASGMAAKSPPPKPVLHHEPHTRRTSVWLVREVRHKLLMLPYYTVFDNLEYRVNGYRVTLLGQVVNPVLKADAEAAVKRIEGVQPVTNDIQVLPPSNFDDQIRIAAYRRIYGYPGFEKYAIQAMPPIHIIVKNGNITLVGVVDSAMDRQIAYMQARSVPGVFSVTNDLRVAKA